MIGELERLRAALADRYNIDRSLGEGSMATVYLADDLKHHRPVAIKVLKAEIASTVEPERFIREIEIAARLTHPHIVPLYDSGDADGLLYHVMPFVEGESLRDRLKRDKQLPVDDAVEIASEVAEALSFAHARGVVHRDIKPENIMFHGGHAAVADFGIAQAVTVAAGDTVTVPGLGVGTPEYMSPEQAGGSSDVDARSDVYSLGCVLYEILGGQPPFAGATVESLVRQHRSADPTPLTVLRSKVPANVSRAVTRSLAKAPADRFDSAAALAEALVSDVPEKTDGGNRRQMLRLTALAVALVAALAVGGRVLGNRRPIPRVAQSVAVIPFTSPSGEAALSRLGRDLAITVGANLDGVGGIRTADALSVLALTREGEAIPLDEGANLAGRLGASSFIHGNVIQIGTDVRIDYGLFETDGSGLLARGRVTGARNDFVALTDSITWGLLREIWQATKPPAVPHLEAITTSSIRALRAYLEGEHLLAQGRFREAPEAFQRAIKADSTFWFAYWRYNYAMAYHGEWVDPDIRKAIVEHLDELPERDRLLIQSRMADGMSERLELARQVTERYPDFWPAWYEYGNQLVHNAPFLGHTLADARSPLEKVVTLNPNFTSAWEHLFWIPIYDPDSAAAGHYLAELRRLRFDSTSLAEVGLNNLKFYSALRDLAGSGGVPDQATISSLAGDMVRYRGFIPPAGLVTEMADFGFHRAQMEMNNAAVAAGAPRAIGEAARRRSPTLWAARGAWDSAMVAANQYASSTLDAEATLYGYRLSVIGAWLGAVDTAAAIDWQKRMAGISDGLSAGDQGGLEWLNGLLAVVRQNEGALRVARSGLQAIESETAPMLARSLAAFALGLEGETSSAARALGDLEQERTEQGYVRMLRRTENSPYQTGINRLAAARWLLASGDTTEAARLLTWHEAVLPGASDTRLADAALAGIAFLERARIEAARGRSELSRAYYRQFLRRYDAPSESVKHLIHEAAVAVGGVEAELTK